jgi:hypothetical protein
MEDNGPMNEEFTSQTINVPDVSFLPEVKDIW